MAPPSSSAPLASRFGCAGLLATTLVSCLLLGANGWVAHRLMIQLQNSTPDWIGRPKMAQVAVFVLPVIFLVVEWWIIDWFRDAWTWRRSQRNGNS